MATRKAAKKTARKSAGTTRSAGAKKTASKKSASKRTGTKRAGTKRAGTKKSVAKKSSGSSRRYSRGASKDVEREMHEFKRGRLKSGSGRKVTNPKQAIAIGLSEARKEGKKVPPAPKKRGRGSR